MEDTPQGPPEAPPPAAPPPPPPEETPQPAPSGGTVSENRSVWVVLSYLGLLALIPLLVEKEDREVQWHAKHGLVLTVFEIVVIIALQIVIMVLGAVSGGLGCLAGLLFPFLLLAILVVHIMGIVKGLKGDRLRLPWISDFADKF
jgi:uncharacterized membrane protein